MNIICSLCIVLSSFATINAAKFSVKGDRCSQFDNCFAKPQQRTCSCAEDCQVYGTCCHDANKQTSKTSNIPFKCYHQQTLAPVFVKRSCPENYAGHVGNVHACFDDDIDDMDIGNNLLVTSRKTKITYWNYHCALCNDEAVEDLALWSIEVFCPSRENVDRWLIRTNLTFDLDKKQWGLNLKGEFVQCPIKYASPPYIDEVKYCTPNFISSCPAGYPKKKVVNRCSQYYAERKLTKSDTYYRNVHCAICNGVHLKELECPGMRKHANNNEKTDFQDMVEEVFANGDWLFQRFKCSAEYSYDPTWKKCRRDKRKPYHMAMVASVNSSQTLQFSISLWLIAFVAFLY